MLKIRCLRDFDWGYPSVLISGSSQDYLRAAKYLLQQNGAYLDDPNCFECYPAEQLIPNSSLDEAECKRLNDLLSKRDWLKLDEKECEELAEIFHMIAQHTAGCHYYYDPKAMDNMPMSLEISIHEYSNDLFTK